MWHICYVSTRIYGICGCISWLIRGPFDDIWTTFVRKRSDFRGDFRRPRRAMPACGRPDSNYRSSVFCAPLRKKIERSRPRRRNRAVRVTSEMLAPGAPAACGCGCWTARRGVRNLYGNVRFVYGFVRFVYGFCGEKQAKAGIRAPWKPHRGGARVWQPLHYHDVATREYGRQQPSGSTRRGRKRAPIGRKRGLTNCRTL